VLHSLRNKAGKFVLMLLSIALIFVFTYDNPLQNMTPQEVGSVNGEKISSRDFYRRLESQKEMFKNMGFPEEQLKMMSLERNVFNSMVQGKLLVQFAEKNGALPSHQEVVDRIQELDFFQENGQFDLYKYKNLLSQNNITPAQFEKDVRDQIINEKWDEYLNGFAKVSESEVIEEYKMLHDERKVRFLYMTFEDARKLVSLSPSEVNKYLEQPENLEKVKERFESQKAFRYKDKKLEEVQSEIAKDFIYQTKREEILAKRKELAEKIASEMSLSAASVSRINQWVKPMDLSVKTDFAVSRKSRNIPGVGEISELMQDLFGVNTASIHLKEGGKPKIYETASGVLILGLESQKDAKLEELDKAQKNSIQMQLSSQKRSALRSDIIRYFNDRSKIKENAAFFRVPDQG